MATKFKPTVRSTKRDVFISVNVTPNEKDLIEKFARRQERPVSFIMRRGVFSLISRGGLS